MGASWFFGRVLRVFKRFWGALGGFEEILNSFKNLLRVLKSFGRFFGGFWGVLGGFGGF